MLRLIVFAILSAALAFVSRASLKAPRSHGFFRFFAWECILALFFMNFINFQQWFGNPFSVRQVIILVPVDRLHRSGRLWGASTTHPRQAG